MAKQTRFSCTIVLLLFWSNGAHATLYLQIGDKCQEEKSHTLFPNYDDLSNSSVVTPGVEVFSGSEVTSAVCDPPLECLAGRCQCRKGYTINRNGTRCLEVARNGLNSSCEENIQCWKSMLGRLSTCDSISKHCRCQVVESESLPIVFHHGRCNYGESLGEFCQIDGLCEATTKFSTCQSGTCQCKDGYVPSWDKSRCIPIALGLNSTCEENIQCEKSLGPLSECSEEMQCTCFRIPDMDTVFYRGTCYFEAALGDVCQVSAQCQKKTSNSVCGKKVGKNGNEKKCVCENGYIPNGNNTLCLAIPSSDGAVGTTTAVLAGGPEAAGGNVNGNNNNNEECLEDSQCFRLFGAYSRCTAKHKCECQMRYANINNMHTTNDNSVISNGSKNYFIEAINEPEQLELLDFPPSLVMIGRKCYLSKYLGQLCKFNKQCSAVTENSWCDNGKCECLHQTHVRSEDGRKCLKIAQKGLDSVCDEDAQCTRSSIGLLSRCENKRCVCSNNVMPVVYYKGKCYFHRQLGSSCESNVECQAVNYLAECHLSRCRCGVGTVRLSDHVCGFNGTATNYGTRKTELCFYDVLLYVIIVISSMILKISS